jgi:hypothetical protein
VANPTSMTQVAHWELPANDNSNIQGTLSLASTSRYIQLTDIKKSQRDKLIASAISHVFTNTHITTSNNPFQYIETVS